MSYKLKFCFFVLINLCFFIFKNELQVNGGPSPITEEQRLEIEKLKSELGSALENYEENVTLDESVIVQPEWTVKGNNKNSKKVVSKVQVTAESLAETKLWRDELLQAVQKDTYKANFNKSQAGSTEEIQKLHEIFAKNMELQQQQKKLSMLGSAKTEDVLLGGAAKLDHKIVDSNAFVESEVDLEKLQKLEMSKRRTKEMLILESIEEDYSFNLGENVQEWEHIMHNGEEYFVGRRQTDLLIVKKDAATYEQAKVLDVGAEITYLETYSYWNFVNQQQEGVVLVATGNKVLWFKGDEATSQITVCWEWLVGSDISGLTYFNYNSKDYLAVSSTGSARVNHYAINIYEFQLQNKEFWIAQRLQLNFPCKEVTMLDTGRDLILAVPQNNAALIYAFNPLSESADYLRLDYLMSVESASVGLVSAFKMGGRSYLAIGGRSAQILLYKDGTFVPNTVMGENFGLVDFYVPIPVRTYRDDMLLLIQHRVEFETHNLTVLETLIWDGESFEISIPVPCHMGTHLVYGVNCMLDMQRPEGIEGAALLRRENEVSLIVPRNKVESGLFRLHTKLLPKNSEILDLQEIFDYMQNWVQEQDELIAVAEAFVKEFSDESDINMELLNSLETPELFFNGDVGELYINDVKWTEEDTNIKLNDIITAMEELESVLFSVRHKREIDAFESYDYLNVLNVEAEEIFIENLNNAPFYIQAGSLIFDGIVNVQNLTVLEESVVREKRQMPQENVQIQQDLEVLEINGILWQNILNNVVFRHQPITLDHLSVDGDVIIEEDLTIQQLNDLNFPEDYLFSNEKTASIVKAEKTFTGRLAANAVDTSGFINGVNPMNAITLLNEQNWTGVPTFSQLEVSEKWQLNGVIQAAEGLPYNLNLNESKVVNANCFFNKLTVLGPIYLNGHLAGIDLAPILLDMAQKPQNPNDAIVINSQKTFSTIEFPHSFNLSSGSINDIPIVEFIAKHTDEVLNITNLPANVYFKNLTLKGLYDGINIFDLLEQSIKVNETQHSPGTQLNFANAIIAEQINVQTSLNKAPIAAYQTIHTDLVVPEAHFTEIQAKIANIPNNIMGEGSLNGIVMQEFISNSNWNNPNTHGNIFLDELVVADGITADELHGLEPTLLFQFLEQIDDIPEMILNGKIHVDQIHVNGNVHINKLNGLQFNEDIVKNVIWLNRENHLHGNITFAQPLVIDGDLQVMQEFNGKNFTEFMGDIIFKGDSEHIVITGEKTFSEEVRVLGETSLESIGGTPMAHFAAKGRQNEFKGDLHIKGNLMAGSMTFESYVNDFPMRNLSQWLQYDVECQCLVLLGNVSFKNAMQLEELTVLGSMQKIPNLPEFLNQLVFDFEEFLPGNFTFTGRVSIAEGAVVNELNGVNLNEMFSNIVTINDAESVQVVHSAVEFMQNVNAVELHVKDTLRTSKLAGNSINDWIKDTLLTNEDQNITEHLTFAAGTLDGNNLSVKVLNDMDLSKVITLYTEQHFNQTLNFSVVYLDGEINAKGLINNVNLQKEFERTLLTYGNQHIKTPLILNNVEVLHNAVINPLVNGMKNLSQVVTLYGRQVLKSPLYFKEVYANDIQTNHTISGINISDWAANALWLNERSQQVVTGNWTSRKLIVKNGPQLPAYLIDGLTDTQYIEYTRTARHFQNLDNLVKQAQHLLDTDEAVKEVKYFKPAFEYEFPNFSSPIKSVKLAHNYLFITVQNNTEVFDLNFSTHNLTHAYTWPNVILGEVFYLAEKQAVLVHNLLNSSLSLYAINDNQLLHNHTFAIKAKSLTQSTVDALIFYAANDDALLQISVAHRNVTKFVKLYNNNNLQLLPFMAQNKLVLCNSTHQLYLNSSNLSAAVKPQKRLEFEVMLKRLTTQLIESLNKELTAIENLTPDEHFATDFMSIMQELENQQVYGQHIFADINHALLAVPTTTAQIVAARSIQIMWPFIVEVKQLRDYMLDKGAPETASHLSVQLMDTLGATMHVVLLRAFNKDNNIADDNTLDLVKQQLSQMEEQLKFILWQNELQAKTELAYLCSLETQPEMLQMSVGLYAVALTDKLLLLRNITTGQLAQELAANEAHLLAEMQLGIDVFLAFVEGCCTVRLSVYRGAAGFVDFMSFSIDEPIVKLLNYIEADGSYFVVVTLTRIIVYNVIM